MRHWILTVLTSLLALTACAPLAITRRTSPALPTPDPATQAILAAVQANGTPTTRLYESPDRVWRIQLALYPCTPTATGEEYAYETLRLARGNRDAVVDSQLINCGGLGAYGLDGLFWSADSRYFYYTTARTGVPDGCGEWQPPIRRVDATVGRTEDSAAIGAQSDQPALSAWLEQRRVHCTPAP